MRGENSFRVTNLVVVIVVAVAVAIAAIELARVRSAAGAINDKAQTIAASGRGINIATDSVIQLNRTNEIADSILRSARPLDDKLATIVNEAQGIDGVARSIDVTAGRIDVVAATIDQRAGRVLSIARDINGIAETIDQTAGDILATAGAINGTAGRINTVAQDINGTAENIDSTAGRIESETGGILDVAKEVDRDVRLINTSLNSSIAIAKLIETDTTDILGLARSAHETAACIDAKLLGSNDGHCSGADPNSAPFAPDVGGVPLLPDSESPPPRGTADGNGRPQRSQEKTEKRKHDGAGKTPVPLVGDLPAVQRLLDRVRKTPASPLLERPSARKETDCPAGVLRGLRALVGDDCEKGR